MSFYVTRASLFATAAIVAVAVASPAAAQARAFNIAGQPAATGIQELARQADIQILVSADLVRGKSTQSVKGVMTVEQALQRLLAGTGLRTASNDGRTVTLVEAPRAATNPQAPRAAPAQVDDASGSAAEAPPEELAEITVTGSRVVRSGFQAPTPTTVLGLEDLQARAPANIADAVNQLPSLSIGLNPNTGNLGSSLGVAGLNILNLRNLGPSRTLVLVNGNRVTPSTSSGLVDINTIPGELIDRVDVVTGGASAAYGSDAVAGVVNFILKKNFTGLAFDAQAGISSRGDGGNRKIEATYGRKFADDRGHFILAGQYSDQDGIFDTANRGWFKSAKLVANPSGAPARIYAAPVNLSTATGGGLILANPANGPLQGVQFGPGGTVSQFQFGAATGTPNLMIGGTPNDLAGIIPISTDVKNRNIFSRVSFDVTPDVTFYAEGSYGKSKVLNPNLYQFFLGNLTIQRDNAFLPDSVRSTMAANSLNSVVFGTYNLDIGKLRVNNDLDTYRGLAGLDAKLGGTWTGNAYVQYGRTDARNAVDNEIIVARYRQAIDAVRDASGNIVCRNAAGGCVPLNVIGNGVASDAAKAWVTGTAERNSKIEELVASGSIQGEPFSTWAGPVSLAFGGEYRKESTHETVDPLSLTSSYFSGNFKPINGSYNVKEGFAEAVVPLAKDVPFLQSLELNSAVRVTDYSTSGTVATWKVGGTWRPVDDILFRAVRSRDIRAPNLADLFANVQATQTVTDPFNGNRSNTITAFLNSGNPDLQPEVSQNLTLGVVLTPRFIPGFSASFDYYDIKVKGFITSIAGNTQQAVDLCFAGNTAACALITRDASNNITSVRLAGVNAGKLKTSGFDIETAYATSVGSDSLSFRLLASKLNKLNVDTSVAFKEYAGEIAGQSSPFGATPAYFPKWKGSFDIRYKHGPLSLGTTARYLGSGVVDNSYTIASISRVRTSAVVYVDANVSYKIETMRGEPEVYLAVDNLFDKDPPLIAPLASNPQLNTGTSPGFYDLIGTQFRMGVRGHF